MFLNNSSFMTLTNNLVKLGNQIKLSNERISTSKKINRASDDPSGIVKINNLKAEIAQIDAMSTNGQRINSVLDTADAGLSGISALLDDIDTAILSAAGDPGNISTYQAEIDTAIDAIDTLVGNTNFAGQKLLDGSKDYTTTNNDTDKISDIRINSANSLSTTTLTVSASGATIASTASDAFVALTEDATIEITGPDGTETLNFTTGDTRADVQAGIQAVVGDTGVTAVNEGGAITFKSANAGASESITLNVTAGSDITFGGQSSTTYTGTDATITVNGQTATLDSTSKSINVSTSDVSGTISLKDGFYDSVAVSTASFSVSGSGAGFALGTDASSKVELGINDMGTSSLGSNDLGYLSSLKSGGANDLDSGNLSKAANIVTEAESQINFSRGKIGAIQNYAVDSVLNSFEASKTQLTSALSDLEDTDLVIEAANNDRLVLLQQMTMSILSSMTENAGSVYTLLKSALG
ncbi:MAG: hypothetical protein JEZ07_03615 [Phycisphaerae bacterium]|nr:hypothetical protein [Phycisphaerae bacterium]